MGDTVLSWDDAKAVVGDITSEATSTIEKYGESKLVEIYKNSSNKLQGLESVLKAKGCDPLKSLQILKGVIEAQTSMVDEMLSVVDEHASKLLNVMNCVSSQMTDSNPDLVKNATQQINNVLSGGKLDQLSNSIDNVVKNIDDMNCDDIFNSLNNILNSFKSITGAFQSIKDQAAQIKEKEQQFAQEISKIGAILNCLTDLLKNDDGTLAKALEMSNPQMTGVITMVKQALDNGSNKKAILDQASKLIAKNIGLENLYKDTTNAIKNLI